LGVLVVHFTQPEDAALAVAHAWVLVTLMVIGGGAGFVSLTVMVTAGGAGRVIVEAFGGGGGGAVKVTVIV